MSATSSIEWTEATWNPIRGCTEISPGCAHCYAKVFAERWRGIKGHPYEQGFDLRLVPEKLDEPKRWKKPKRIFVNSMSDLFHDAVPEEFIFKVCVEMAHADHHVYQVLTKRDGRMSNFLSRYGEFGRLSHVWWGVSVENRRHGLPRVETLRQTVARNRWLSVEPLLEQLGQFELSGIHWVVVGGESGASARLCDVRWIREVRDQCHQEAIPCFVKQLGSKPELPEPVFHGQFDRFGFEPIRLKDRKGGDPAEWPEDLRVREYPAGMRA